MLCNAMIIIQLEKILVCDNDNGIKILVRR